MTEKVKRKWAFRDSYVAYFLMYNFYFLAYSLFSTLISVYMLDKGYKAAEVSFVVAASYLASMLVQPLIGYLNDRFGSRPVTLISFVFVIVAGIGFMYADSLWSLTLTYSLALMLINGVNPGMDLLAAKSPYKYGQIRIWGTIGYALGSQLSGWLYEKVSPVSIFPVFVAMMLISIIGTLAVSGQPPQQKEKRQAGMKELWSNRTFLVFLLVIGILSGVTNTGHTYIPAMLHHAGLSVDLATTVVSIAVICESPLIFFSYLFMDKIDSKKLMIFPMILVLAQFFVFSIPGALPYKILLTLIAKHAANMILIMVAFKVVASLVSPSVLMTALALLQTVKNLFSILLQQFSGNMIDWVGYEGMSLMLTGTLLLVLLMTLFLKLPASKNDQLFS